MEIGSIYTMTFNPSIDYIAKTDEFIVGETNRTTQEFVFPGGKGINVSIVLKNMGMPSTILGFEAGFTGMEIKRLLEKMYCYEDLIHVDEGMSRINVKIEAHDETELNGMGPVISDGSLQVFYDKLENFNEGDILVLAGSIPKNVSKTVYADILKRLNKKGVYVVVDATGELLLNSIKEHPFLVKPNQYELGEIFNVNISGKQDAIKYSKKLIEMGAQNVLVSMGGYGAVLVTEDLKEYRAYAPSGKLINSVGAGDSMVAGFIYGYFAKGSYEEAFKYAVAAGSASAFSENLATKEEIEKLVKEISL